MATKSFSIENISSSIIRVSSQKLHEYAMSVKQFLCERAKIISCFFFHFQIRHLERGCVQTEIVPGMLEIVQCHLTRKTS